MADRKQESKMDFQMIEKYERKFTNLRKFKKELLANMERLRNIGKRWQCWMDLLPNWLKISPELYLHLENISKENVCGQSLGVIQMDLNWVFKNFGSQMKSQTEEDGQGETWDWLMSEMELILKIFEAFWQDISYTQGMAQLIYVLHSVIKDKLNTFICFSNLILGDKMIHCFFNLDMKKLTLIGESI